LSGAAIGQDKDATREFYGRMDALHDFAHRHNTRSTQCVSVPEHVGPSGLKRSNEVSANVGASAPLVLKRHRRRRTSEGARAYIRLI